MKRERSQEFGNIYNERLCSHWPLLMND